MDELISSNDKFSLYRLGNKSLDIAHGIIHSFWHVILMQRDLTARCVRMQQMVIRWLFI